MAATFVLSPHYDDAVLFAWHLLAGEGEVHVVTVFTSSPASGREPGWWDAITGATSPVKRMRERAAEDAKALQMAGRKGISLGFLDHQYREGDQPLEPIVERLRRVLEPGSRIAAPAAVRDHEDHVLLRDAGITLGREGHQLLLYSDLPAKIEDGKLSWPDFDPAARADDAAARVSLALGLAGLPPACATDVHALSGEDRQRKLDAVSCYRTQLAGLERFGLAGLLGTELTWG